MEAGDARQETEILPSSAQYRALAESARVINAHRDVQELFHDLARRLSEVVSFNYLSVMLYDAKSNAMRLQVLETAQPSTVQTGEEYSMEESPSAWVWRQQQTLYVADVEDEARFDRVIKILVDHSVRSFYSIPLTTAQRRLGAISFGDSKPSAYGPAEQEMLRLLADNVAVAIENSLNYEEAREYQQQLAHDRDRLRLLLDLNNSIVSNLELRELFSAISSGLRRVMHFDFVSLALEEPDGKHLRVYILDFPGGKGFITEETLLPYDGSASGVVMRSGKPLPIESFEKLRSELGVYRNAESEKILKMVTSEGLISGCFLPLYSRGKIIGVLQVARRESGALPQEDIEFLSQVSTQIAIGVDNALNYHEINLSRERLTEEKRYLKEEIGTEHNFEEIIGESNALKAVLREVETVAPTDSTVLIQGETGTGKELIARAIHNLSSRSNNIFVKLNCAAIPLGLLESELFGHERGAFTGAIARKIGRFETADKGTLFLDEIGDIPLELQPKLLRVLQEQEFERLGSTRTQKVDVRLVAATNQDLKQMVDEKKFRSDLYYRLNIFPIRIPSLRERREDIPLLVRHFTSKYGRQMNRRIEVIPDAVMKALVEYSWPGNIRELQNFVERAVILSSGSRLEPLLGELKAPAALSANTGSGTLEDAEREHILKALEESKWVIGGPSGAANRLGLKRTTLISRMQKLGISRSR